MAAKKQLNWALCIATLNRVDALKACIHHAMQQTRPPVEIIIVDASSTWQNHSEQCKTLLDKKSIELIYMKSPRKSLTAQRNLALSVAKADVCFMIDDDSFMHPDCAEEIMKVYEHPAAQEVLAVAASDASVYNADGTLELTRKDGGLRNERFSNLFENHLFRFFWSEIALMSPERLFIPHSGPYQRDIPPSLAASGLNIISVSMIGGYKLTVRRKAALETGFEDTLESYCAAEDLDFSYRLSQKGYLVAAKNAKLYHHEIAASRLKRRIALTLSITNVAYFVRRNSVSLGRDRFRFTVMLLRRFIAETIKDVGSRRWHLPQVRGAFIAAPISMNILFYKDNQSLTEWYKHQQLAILGAKT